MDLTVPKKAPQEKPPELVVSGDGKIEIVVPIDKSAHLELVVRIADLSCQTAAVSGTAFIFV